MKKTTRGENLNVDLPSSCKAKRGELRSEAIEKGDGCPRMCKESTLDTLERERRFLGVSTGSRL